MLFGHQNDDKDQTVQDASAPQSAPLAPPPTPGANPLAVDEATGVSLPAVAPQPTPGSDINTTEPSALDQPNAPDENLVNAPEPTTFAPTPVEQPVTDALSTPEAEQPSVVPTPSTAVEPDSGELLSLKQQALSQLSPLIGKLDQTPEEKFRTTMMLIQTTDNQSLLKEAYDAAQAITDEKARAQALLDVVNEINYFTQQKPAA